jgi:hypothetical protein
MAGKRKDSITVNVRACLLHFGNNRIAIDRILAAFKTVSHMTGATETAPIHFQMTLVGRPVPSIRLFRAIPRENQLVPSERGR